MEFCMAVTADLDTKADPKFGENELYATYKG